MILNKDLKKTTELRIGVNKTGLILHARPNICGFACLQTKNVSCDRGWRKIRIWKKILIIKNQYWWGMEELFRWIYFHIYHKWCALVFGISTMMLNECNVPERVMQCARKCLSKVQFRILVGPLFYSNVFNKTISYKTQCMKLVCTVFHLIVVSNHRTWYFVIIVQCWQFASQCIHSVEKQ